MGEGTQAQRKGTGRTQIHTGIWVFQALRQEIEPHYSVGKVGLQEAGRQGGSLRVFSSDPEQRVRRLTLKYLYLLTSVISHS